MADVRHRLFRSLTVRLAALRAIAAGQYDRLVAWSARHGRPPATTPEQQYHAQVYQLAPAGMTPALRRAIDAAREAPDRESLVKAGRPD